MLKISEEQVQELSEYENFIEHPRLLKRINSIQMLALGIKGNDVAKMKKISYVTVSNYKRAYEKGGIEGLLKRRCTWWVGKLKEKQKEILKEKWEKDWFDTASEAQNFIKEKFWIEYKLRRVQYLLKKWNFHTKKQRKYQEMLQTKKSKKILK